MPKDRPFEETEIRHYRHGYYASISFLDAQIGEILDALDASGKANDTIIVFTSDHGFHIGEHSLWGKTSNFELDARVPLIVCDPQHTTAHGKQSGALIELVDLFPTLVELTGLTEEVPTSLQGKSFAKTVADPVVPHREFALTQHQQPFYGKRSSHQAMGYSIRSERWRYTEWRPIDGETELQSGKLLGRELYDHENDPIETVNVVDRNDMQSVVGKLAKQLSKRLAASSP